jgi:hypothetical protein
MPHSIFFHGGYAIHGSYAISQLGGPASHGCVRLHPRDAATLFKMVKAEGMANTKIVIRGQNPVVKPSSARIARARRAQPPVDDPRVYLEPRGQAVYPDYYDEAPRVYRTRPRRAPRYADDYDRAPYEGYPGYTYYYVPYGYYYGR